MKKLLALSILMLISASGFHCTEEEDECVDYPGICRSMPYDEGTLTIYVTINDENPVIYVNLYQGNYEDDDLLQELILDEDKYTFTLPVGEYSATVDYLYQENTVTCIDGDSISNTSGEYCEGTCYDIKNGELDLLLDEEAFEEKLSGREDKCFIATAAYGSVNAENVILLREFRDKYLLGNPIGEKFVRLYYSYSPQVAQYIRDKFILKYFIRKLLDPIIFLVQFPVIFLFYIIIPLAIKIFFMIRKKILTVIK